MTFEECCFVCLKNESLVKEFNRLTGLSLGEKRSKIDKIIDDACKYDPDKAAMPAFVSFVRDYVWSQMLNNDTLKT